MSISAAVTISPSRRSFAARSRFWVSVPVLSLHMTVTEPSVSTAGSRRMTALREAIRRTPIASVMVMIAGRPSGMAATISATPATRPSANAMPCSARPAPMTSAVTTISSMVK